MIYLDNNTFQQEIFIPRSSVKNDASPEYATKNELENAIENEVIRADEKYAAKTDLLPYATTGWVESQDFATKEWTDEQIQSAITSETERTEETYQKKSEMGIYSTTNEVENMIDGAVSGKMDTSAMSAYTKTEDFATINGSAITEGGNIIIEGGGSDYSAGSNINIDENNVISVTGITVPTKISELVNDEGYITTADTQNFVTSSDVQTQINDSISGKADSSAVTAQISAVKQEIEAEIPSKVSSLENDLNFVNSGDVKTQVESYNYINSGQAQTQIDSSISGKLDTDAFTAYTANTQTELNNKQDVSGMTEYATTAFTESTYLKEHQSLSAYSTTEQVQTLINTAKQEVENEIPDVSNFVTSAQVETQITNKGYITGYTETDPVFMASAASGISAQDITNWNGKQPSGDYALRSELPTVPTSNTAFTNDAGYITDAALNGYATTAFTESTYLKEHQSLSAYTPTSGFSTINGNVITDGGNIVVEETPYSGGTNIDITDHIISVTGITVPTKLSELTNDSGYINSEQAQTQIDNSVSGKVDTDIFTAYTANTKTEIDNAVSGKVDSSRVDEIEEVTASALVELNSKKQDILVSGTNIKTINNQSLLGSGNIEIQGGSGSDYSAGANIDITDNVISVTGITVPTKLSELTNDEGFVNSGEVETQITSKGYITGYTESDPVFQASAASGISEQDITNWNNKLDSSALTPYYTSAQTNTAISNAVSGKTDKVSVESNDFECMFPTWNDQGCITGTNAIAYQASQYINDLPITVYSDSHFPLPTIYAPESAGSAGQPLLSNGDGAPVWASYKFQFISQSQYDALATKDSTTIYFIVN